MENKSKYSSYFDAKAQREIDQLRRIKDAERRAKETSPTAFNKLSFLEQLAAIHHQSAPQRFDGSRDATRWQIAEKIKESKENEELT